MRRARRAASWCPRPISPRRVSPRRPRRAARPRLLGVCACSCRRAPARSRWRATPASACPRRRRRSDRLDLADVRGQAAPKRALLDRRGGRHSLLLVGPPGTGKSMLAQRLPGLLPALDADEALDVASIASVSVRGFDPRDYGRRPFRAPHHTASAGAIIGGGPHARPGEVSLAHRGVLFLDELPEFNRSVLEVLREPLETGVVAISRAALQVEYPARFQLDRRDESLSLRLSRRDVRPLPLRAAGDRALPRAHLRAAARSHRPARRGARAAERRVVRRRRGPGSPRAPPPASRGVCAARANCSWRAPASSTPSLTGKEIQQVCALDRACRLLLAQARAKLHALGARRPPRVARGAHHRRSGRRHGK